MMVVMKRMMLVLISLCLAPGFDTSSFAVGTVATLENDTKFRPWG